MLGLIGISAFFVVFGGIIYWRLQYEKTLKEKPEKRRIEKKALLWISAIYIFSLLIQKLDAYMNAP